MAIPAQLLKNYCLYHFLKGGSYENKEERNKDR